MSTLFLLNAHSIDLSGKRYLWVVLLEELKREQGGVEIRSKFSMETEFHLPLFSPNASCIRPENLFWILKVFVRYIPKQWPQESLLHSQNSYHNWICHWKKKMHTLVTRVTTEVAFCCPSKMFLAQSIIWEKEETRVHFCFKRNGMNFQWKNARRVAFENDSRGIQ